MNRMAQVAFVDDDKITLKYHESIAKNTTLIEEVLTFSDPKEFLLYLGAADVIPDIIFTDVEMPDVDGFDLIAELKKMNMDIKTSVVIVSSHKSIENTINAVDLSVKYFIEKPLTEKKIEEIVISLS